jgi:putative Holliday junction resolvase
LGIDPGAARVGVALSDPDGTLAMPLTTIHRSGLDDAAVVTGIVQLVQQNAAERVVVGLPLHLDGRAGVAAQAAQVLAEALSQALPASVGVDLQDERNTTVQAHDLLHQAGRKAKKHRQAVDQVAAVVLLQAALDHKRVKLAETSTGKDQN